MSKNNKKVAVVMTLSEALRHFPKSHVLGVSALFVLIVTLFLWPSSNSSTDSASETSFVIEMTELPESSPAALTLNWENTKVKSGDNLSVLFSRHNLSASEVLEVVNAVPKAALKLLPGQELRWVRTDDNKLQQFQIILSPLAYHSLSRDDEGNLAYELIERDAEYRPQFASTTIENSLFVDGLKAGIPQQILFELANIFGWDIDFALDIRQGDSFSLIYDEIYLDGEQIGTGHILATEFNNRGRTIRALRYTDKNGKSDYYTPEGQSMRKEFLRNPIDFTRISSRFSNARKHPVLNSTIRAHKGTDYAAPTGTPIKAAGDGKVIFAGRKGGYGNAVIIQHGAKYQTLYGHLSKFNRNTKSGRYVKQGQIIGYVGMTGLATGPHLHYEFRVNGVHRDPLRVELPKAQNIAAEFRSDFSQRSQSMMNWLSSYTQQTSNVSRVN